MFDVIIKDVNGCEPNKTIAPLSFIILLYSDHNLSNGIITSQEFLSYHKVNHIISYQ